MKKKIFKCVCLIMVVNICAGMLTGFVSASDRSTDMEIVSSLLDSRTKIMQRIMFDAEGENDVFSELAAIETYPLLTEDWNSAQEIKNSDCDLIINMHVKNVLRIKKLANLYFYNVTVDWYMAGCDGYYTESDVYEIRVMASNRKYLLFDMIPLS